MAYPKNGVRKRKLFCLFVDVKEISVQSFRFRATCWGSCYYSSVSLPSSLQQGESSIQLFTGLKESYSLSGLYRLSVTCYQGKVTIKIAWNRITVDCLENGIKEVIPRYRE